MFPKRGDDGLGCLHTHLWSPCDSLTPAGHSETAGLCVQPMWGTHLTLPWFRPTYLGIAALFLDTLVIHVSQWPFHSLPPFPLLFSTSAFFTFNEKKTVILLETGIFRLSLKSVSLLEEALILCEGPEGLALFIG